MIARQRDNLKHTFAHLDDTHVETPTAERLARTEGELAEATADFTAGIEKRAGPVPCLHEAQDAMRAAEAALGQKDLNAAGGSEEKAVAALVKARQNLRQFLSQGGQSASACRSFDNQQKQKIRKPPQDDRKQRLARMQDEIDKLARTEKKFSEDVAAKAGGGAQVEKKDDPAGSLAERQQQAAEKAEELRRLVREDDALTELARERMDAAADAAQASVRSLQAGQEREAGKQAAEAAEQLERLARHVAGLKAPELMTRLGQGESLARQLARQQQALGQGLEKKDGARGAADEEHRLAEEARTLADLLGRLQRDAADRDRDLAEQLREAGEANPPQTAADQMRRAAEALAARRPDEARPDVEQSARLLDGLGQHLEAARHALAGPQLDRLMALEKQADDAQKALESVNDGRQKAEAERKLADLRDALEALPQKDGKLAGAADRLDAALHNAGGWHAGAGQVPERGAYVPPVEYGDAVGGAVRALQASIQEIILRDALLDKDEAVPPQYRKLVEEYYRVLSEDLR